jgi:hypothetical protein
MSLQAAGYGVALGSILGYLGFDPLNVTPGYGISFEGGTVTEDGIPFDYSEKLFDMRQFYM